MGSSEISAASSEESSLLREDEVSGTELSQRLADHEAWLRTGGEQGRRADLTDRSLKGQDLSHTSLERGALKHAIFEGANLSECSLVEANLEGANLKQAVGLAAPQLAGAILTGAQLPEPVRKFELLEYANELSKDTQRLFAGLVLACGYCWLTVANTGDVHLFRNTSSSELPIIKTSVPILYIYVFAPLLLLGLYLYFHIYMQRLWEALALLPSVFPDGIHLRQKIAPWIYNGFIFAHLRGGAAESDRAAGFTEHALQSLQMFLCVLLAWCLAPISLFLLWGRYLRRQQTSISIFQSALVACGFAAAAVLYFLARNTLRDRHPTSMRHFERRGVALALGVFCITGALSLAVHHVSPPAAMLAILAIDFREAEVSSKPAGWEQLSEEFSQALRQQDERAASRGSSLPAETDGGSGGSILPDTPVRYLYGVKGALLALNHRELNLQRSRAFGAFLVNADLQDANLREADLTQADLRGALLQHAHLEKAHLGKARLNFAALQKATLAGADLSDADLRRADLFQADFRNADLSGARLENTRLIADLRETDMTGAHLSGTVLAYCRLDRARLNSAKATGMDLTRSIATGADFTDAELQKTDLTEANLSGADLRWSKLAEANLARALLAGAKLQDADFAKADLTAADLSGAILDGANFSGAKLKYVKGLTKEQLRNADRRGNMRPRKIMMDARTECPDELIKECRDLIQAARQH